MSLGESAAVLMAERFEREWVADAVHVDPRPVEVDAWVVPGEPVPFADAVAATYTPLAEGDAWGRPWGTTWLRLGLPEVRRGDELVVDLGFTGGQAGFQCEGLVLDARGRVLKGLAPFANAVTLPADLPTDAEGRVVLYVEAASNPDIIGRLDFVPTPLGDPETAGDEPLYRFGSAVVARLDTEVWELRQDLAVVLGLARTLPDGDRLARITTALGDLVAAMDPEDVAGTASAGRTALAPALAEPASAGTHRIVATGHAHIDSAWLWPTRETVRKCARTFANVLDLMDRDPLLTFTCSSAQQYVWVKEAYPDLFERIRARVAEARWIPVGGMWVESDTNMPGGEALVRQFTAGTRFFLEEFGVESRTVWLPDTFGYSAALPQIARLAGSDSLLTQKTSWNDTNLMPHHSFLWEGIDGTRLLTHFPPVDTYNSDLSVAELRSAESRFRDKGASDVSLVPFGWGDGGGGPTREMLAAARRAGSLDGVPRVEVGDPHAFFKQLAREYRDPPVWAGELYLELHRGTFSSQARTKHGNRRCESLLHEAELWCTTASVLTGAAYPTERIEAAWRQVLLQQFHDILPGSSVAWVHREAEREYERVAGELEVLIAAALQALAGDGDLPLAANASALPVSGVPAHGVGEPASAPPVRLGRSGHEVRMGNDALTVVVRDGEGVVSLVETATGREVVPTGRRFGEVQVFRDLPNRWDAWDLDRSYRALPLPVDDPVLESAEVDGDGAARVVLRMRHGRSAVRQAVLLRPGAAALEFETTVDWQERRKVLKLAFPIDVVAPRTAGETQFGHIERPTHANTTWDVARYEFPAHRWVRVADAEWGVGIANDRIYGHDATADVGAGGRRITVLRQTLLRASTFPDPTADAGEHTFRSSVVPGSLEAAIAEGRRLNLPLRRVRGARAVAPLVAVDGAGVLLETVKPAFDGSGDVVVRLSQATGGRSAAVLRSTVPLAAVRRTDLLERELDGPHPPLGEDGVRVELGPFEILTLRLTPAARAAG